MRPVLALIAALLMSPLALAAEEATPHATVIYEGIDNTAAKALARTIEAARTAYAEGFGFAMPEALVLKVDCGPGKQTRLYTDGESRIYLSMSSKEVLARPAVSGVFNLYGMCHELGHIVMYRTLRNRAWLRGEAAEAWAHYAGSTVVDAVYAAEGPDLWPDKYDYRQDGTARLKRQLAGKSQDKTTAAAGQWLALEAIIGKTGFGKLFAGWNDAKADAGKPADALLLQEAMLKLWPDKSEALTSWWKDASPLLIEMRPQSNIKPVVIPPGRLTGKPTLLKYDDDTKDGARSIAGGGHARRFVVPDGEWYIRSVAVFGNRYGYPRAPAENFEIALCDSGMRTITSWKKPYGSFGRGDPRWARVEVPATKVPKEFYVCLVFHPTATKGVHVAYDSSTTGGSQVATPGKPGESFDKGDWMIRVEVDTIKPAATKPATR